MDHDQNDRFFKNQALPGDLGILQTGHALFFYSIRILITNFSAGQRACSLLSTSVLRFCEPGKEAIFDRSFVCVRPLDSQETVFGGWFLVFVLDIIL